PEAGFAPDELRVPGVVGQRRPDLVHQDFDVLREHVRVRPHRGQDFGLGDESPLGSNQAGQKISSLPRHPHTFGPPPEHAIRFIEAVGGDGHSRLALLSSGWSQIATIYRDDPTVYWSKGPSVSAEV